MKSHTVDVDIAERAVQEGVTRLDLPKRNSGHEIILAPAEGYLPNVRVD